MGTLFLTHRDDVADHATFRKRFACERILHEDDMVAGTRGVERTIGGREPVRLADDLVAIPTPGHTRGHAVLLHRDRYLFTGDHLAWSRRRGRLVAFRDACWYSWDEQIRLDGAASRLPVRVGPAGPWRLAPGILARRDAPRDRGLHRRNAGG